MSGISSHVLDTARGRPAAGVVVQLERWDPAAGWQPLGAGSTDAQGRIAHFEPGLPLSAGEHRLRFETAEYFARQTYFTEQGQAAFYPRVEVTFVVTSPSEHYHIPLLLSPFGYSTYRGS
jgi:5-hydroxyisourate hydrolase